jgi:hypothetical protein
MFKAQMAYRQVLAKCLAAPKTVYTRFETDDDLERFLKTPIRSPDGACPRHNPAMDLFFDRHGDQVAHLFGELKANFAHLGLLDRSEYASFMDIFVRSVFVKVPLGGSIDPAGDAAENDQDAFDAA